MVIKNSNITFLDCTSSACGSFLFFDCELNYKYVIICITLSPYSKQTCFDQTSFNYSTSSDTNSQGCSGMSYRCNSFFFFNSFFAIKKDKSYYKVVLIQILTTRGGVLLHAKSDNFRMSSRCMISFQLNLLTFEVYSLVLACCFWSYLDINLIFPPYNNLADTSTENCSFLQVFLS